MDGGINPKVPGRNNQNSYLPIDISRPVGNSSKYLNADAGQSKIVAADVALNGGNFPLSTIAIGYGSNYKPLSNLTNYGSVAIGFNATGASGSVCIGNQPNQTSYGGVGFSTTVVGYSAVASGDNGIAIGTSSTSTGVGAITIGYTSTALAGSVVSIGKGAAGTNTNVVRIGGSNSGNTSGINAIAIGGPSITKANSMIFGACAFQNAIGDFQGQITFATGYWSSAGALPDYLVGVHFINLMTQTTNATTTELGTPGDGIDVPTTRIILSNDSSYIFDCDIIARNTTDDTTSAAWNLKFAIRRGVAAANTVLVGTPTKTIIGVDTSAATWDVSVTADTTNGRPNISVTGAAATTIRWVANVRMTKVSG